MKTKTLLEQDLLFLVRARANEARNEGEASRIIVEIYPPTKGRFINWKISWDCEVSPFYDERENSIIVNTQIPNDTPKHLRN